MSKFKNNELELSTYVPPYDSEAEFYTICDEAGNIIGVNQPSWVLTIILICIYKKKDTILFTFLMVIAD